MLLFRRWLITIICLFAIIASLGFIKFTQIKAAIAFGESFPEQSETVQIAEATWSQWQPYIDLVGELSALQTVEIRNELEGIVTIVGFTSGAKVKKNQMLIQLNIETEMAQLEAIDAEIALAKLDVKRFTDLLDVNASSREQLDRAKAQLAINQARARALQATIDKKTLVAPFDGIANIHDWQVGSYIAGNTLITQITGGIEQLWVDFNIPQNYANIDTTMPIQVYIKEFSDTPISANISAINQQFNTNSRTIQVRAKLNNIGGRLKPGSAVSIRMPKGTPLNVIELPNEAIRYDAFGSFVNTLAKDDKGDYRAERRPVVVSSKGSTYSYVSSGLESGEIVATIGSSKLSPNMLTIIAKK